MPSLCHLSRLCVSLQVGIPSESECLCLNLGMSFSRLVFPPPPVSLRRVDRLISVVLMAVVFGIVYIWPIEPHFLRDLSSVHHQPLWLWCHWWNHPLMLQWMWYPMLRVMFLQDGLLTAASHHVGVRIRVAGLDHLRPSINLKLDCCLGLLPLH